MMIEGQWVETELRSKPLCDCGCGNPHGYKHYELVGSFVFWFFTEHCRTRFMRKVPLSADKRAAGVA